MFSEIPSVAESCVFDPVGGNVLVKSARILRQGLDASREINLVACPSGRSGILACDEDSFAILVEVHGEPRDSAANLVGLDWT
jgi:hypothetical protein